MDYSPLINAADSRVVTPTDRGYDEARAVYNAMIDRRPAAIVFCRSEAAVIEAVNFARTHELEVAVRSGGHNGAGLAVVDHGLVIDVSEMNAIRVDPATRTAVVQAGCLLKDVDAATYAHGLALPSGIIGTTGIGGLTLGGGMGYLSRKGGLTIDRLLECRVVLASGEAVTANEQSHADLFWALRGGGGNFGVVTSFTFDLLAVGQVYGGPMFWPIAQAREVMQFYDATTKHASNDLYGFFAFLKVPPAAPFPEHLWNERVCGVVWNYTGPLHLAEEVFKPIRAFGTPVLDFVSELPMPSLNGMFDALYPPGLQWYWRAHYLKELTVEAIEVNIHFGEDIPNFHSTTHLYPIDGAVHDVDREATAWAYRDARWAQVIVGVDPNPANAERITNWCKDFHTALAPYAMGGAYVNFMMAEGQDRVKASYGKNY